jgi:hypothetical protein
MRGLNNPKSMPAQLRWYLGSSNQAGKLESEEYLDTVSMLVTLVVYLLLG